MYGCALAPRVAPRRRWPSGPTYRRHCPLSLISDAPRKEKSKNIHTYTENPRPTGAYRLWCPRSYLFLSLLFCPRKTKNQQKGMLFASCSFPIQKIAGRKKKRDLFPGLGTALFFRPPRFFARMNGNGLSLFDVSSSGTLFLCLPLKKKTQRAPTVDVWRKGQGHKKRGPSAIRALPPSKQFADQREGKKKNRCCFNVFFCLFLFFFFRPGLMCCVVGLRLGARRCCRNGSVREHREPQRHLTKWP